MEIEEYKNIFEDEASHFFYVTTHRLVISLIEKFLPRAKRDLEILDAGCGTGLLTKKLEGLGKVVGIDINPQALMFARRRGLEGKKASVTKLPFKDKTFDLLTSIDVIYHRQVSDDQKALKEFFRVLKPNGLAILRVPANKWLRLAHDKIVYTKRRYQKKELVQKLVKAGFMVEKLSFVNASLLLLAVGEHFREKIFPAKSPSSAIRPLPQLVNKVMIFLLSIENYFLTTLRLPFGLGLLAVCRKPKDRV